MITKLNGLSGTFQGLPAASWPAVAGSRRDVCAVTVQAVRAELCLSARLRPGVERTSGVVGVESGSARFGTAGLERAGLEPARIGAAGIGAARIGGARIGAAGVGTSRISTSQFGIDALVHASVLMTSTPMTRLDEQFGPADAIGRDPKYGYTPQRSGTRVWKPPV